MTFSRFSAAWAGLLLIPGLVVSACGDDAAQSTDEPCSGADCAGANQGTAGKSGQNTGGKGSNTAGSSNAMAGESSGGMSTDPEPSAGASGTSDGGQSMGGQSSSGGVGGQPDPVEPLGDGEPCEDGDACGSGFCADGVCGGSACEGSCYSCLGSETGNNDGHCLPVISGTDPGNDCAENAASCQAGVCNGSGACKKADDGTVCREAQGVCDIAEVCNGEDWGCPSDVLSTASVEACPGYKCSGGSAACPTTCQTKADCSPARFCNTNHECVLGKRIFMTSTTHAANFGALTNADAICNARAQEAGLFGTYMAWVSSTTSNIATRSSHSTYPYYRLDGTTPMIIANNWDDLIDGTTVAIATDETGAVRGYEAVFTGTEATGIVATNNCQNWSTTSGGVLFAAGNSSAGAFAVPNWSHYWDNSCGSLAHFYCVQQ